MTAVLSSDVFIEVHFSSSSKPLQPLISMAVSTGAGAAGGVGGLVAAGLATEAIFDAEAAEAFAAAGAGVGLGGDGVVAATTGTSSSLVTSSGIFDGAGETFSAVGVEPGLALGLRWVIFVGVFALFFDNIAKSCSVAAAKARRLRASTRASVCGFGSELLLFGHVRGGRQPRTRTKSWLL